MLAMERKWKRVAQLVACLPIVPRVCSSNLNLLTSLDIHTILHTPSNNAEDPMVIILAFKKKFIDGTARQRGLVGSLSS